MKRTIKGVVCDTNVAKKLGFKHVGEFGAPEGFEEQLFLTKSGQYFLYGVGGPESPYKKPAIKLLKDEKAADWKQENRLN